MYHISHDKRAEKSAGLIYQGLLDCLRRKPFDQITVTDIQQATGVARTTFYRSFDNLSDVLFWRCDQCFQEALHAAPSSQAPSESTLMQGYFRYWTAHSDILRLLIDINRPDIICACHMKNAQALEASYGALPGLDEKGRRYFMAIRTGVTISVLEAWLDGGRRETPEELVRIIVAQASALSGLLHP